MAAIKVSVINKSTVLTDAAVAAAVPALAKQVHRDFLPAWGIDADVDFIAKGKAVPKESWQLVILDNSDQAGALGYHDLTKSGEPIGKVFAKTDLTYGNLWTVTASHELLEMLGDPQINLNVYVIEKGRPRIYAYENCDACEADEFGYEINGVRVSDFVTPEWFEQKYTQKTILDFRKLIKKPLTLLPGGYLQYFEISGGTGWQQVTAATAKASKFPLAARPHVGSRRERRRTLRENWLPSRV